MQRPVCRLWKALYGHPEAGALSAQAALVLVGGDGFPPVLPPGEDIELPPLVGDPRIVRIRRLEASPSLAALLGALPPEWSIAGPGDGLDMMELYRGRARWPGDDGHPPPASSALRLRQAR